MKHCILRAKSNVKKKFEQRTEKDKITALDRNELLCSDERYKLEDIYYADFLGCTAYYNFIGRKIPNIKNTLPSDLSIKEEINMLSDRNLTCLSNIISATYKRDQVGYWHELSDFIHNYRSKNAVSIDECKIFVELYETGCYLWKIS